MAIFISYRREDASGWAGRLQEELSRAFSTSEVFYDLGSIEIGEDFVEVMRRSLNRCAAVIVVIGPHWLQATDEAGVRRLEDPRTGCASKSRRVSSVTVCESCRFWWAVRPCRKRPTCPSRCGRSPTQRSRDHG